MLEMDVRVGKMEVHGQVPVLPVTVGLLLSLCWFVVPLLQLSSLCQKEVMPDVTEEVQENLY